MWETIGSDKDRLNLFLFDVDGATFTGRFVRLWAPGEHEQLTKGCVEFEAESGERVALPAYDYLWNTMSGELEAGVKPGEKLYRVTRVRKTTTKAGNSYMVLSIQRMADDTAGQATGEATGA